ncbi:MAG: formyltransferase family protein [Dehalococcoidia bacterium]
MLKLGWFSTGRGQGSRNLLNTVHEAIQEGDLEARIPFVFSNRELGEAEGSDVFFQLVKSYGIPLINYSSKDFKTRWQDSPQEWRIHYDREVMKRIDPFNPDLCVLAGYMLIVGPEMCHKYSMINLHPAPPGGPTGTWQEVIWHLIEKGASKSGAMMHLVTEELDKGPPVAYCTFSIRGHPFDEHWGAIERRSVEELKSQEGEEFPLFKLIRQHGAARELPLVMEALKAFAQGRVKVVNGAVVDFEGKPIKGYDLTEEINRKIKAL